MKIADVVEIDEKGRIFISQELRRITEFEEGGTLYLSFVKCTSYVKKGEKKGDICNYQLRVSLINRLYSNIAG
jgi:hypothetical protein